MDGRIQRCLRSRLTLGLLSLVLTLGAPFAWSFVNVLLQKKRVAIDYDFTTATQLPHGLYFTRASTATYTNASGIITTAAINQPRFDYDPIRLVQKGLLMEPGTTNYALQSGNLAAGVWLDSGGGDHTAVTVTANATTAPNGTVTATLMTETTETNIHGVAQNIYGYDLRTPSTISMYAKPASGSRGVFFAVVDQTSYADEIKIFCDVSSGKYYLDKNGGGVVSGGGCLPVGNGWYRLWVSGTLSLAGLQVGVQTVLLPVTSAGISFAGSTSASVYVWGVQIEPGLIPTTYIPTTTAPVVRSADKLVTQDLSWYNSNSGTLFSQSINAGSKTGFSFQTFGVYKTDAIGTFAQDQMHLADNGTTFKGQVSSANASQFAPSESGFGGEMPNKMALSYRDGDFAFSANGSTPTTSAAGTVPTGITKAYIGSQPDGAMRPRWLQRIRYDSTNLAAAAIQSLTQHPCDGKSVGQACDGTTALYAGQFNGAYYMIPPSGCTNSTTPTCAGGTDTVTKSWKGTGGMDWNHPYITDVPSVTAESSTAERGDTTTPYITDFTAITADSAADYCRNMVYGGYSDWYLPSKSELAYIYCNSAVSSHNASYPNEDPNCATYGGKSSGLTGSMAAGYWSSSEAVDSTAASQNFSTGLQSLQAKATVLGVKCVRRYEFTLPPSVAWTVPVMRLATGGGTLSISGTNFKPGLTIKVNGTACGSPTYVSSTVATCTIPAAAAGTIAAVDVEVTNPDGLKGTLAESFFYLGAPRGWWRADAGVQQVVAGRVDWWFDQSGNGADFQQYMNSGTNPVYTSSSVAFNGMPVLTFNGGQILETYAASMFRNTSGASVFLASSVSTLTDGYLFSAETNTAATPRFILAANNALISGAARVGANTAGHVTFHGRHQDADPTQYVRGGTITTGTAFQLGMTINYPSRLANLYLNRGLIDSSTTFGSTTSAGLNSATSDSMSQVIGGRDGYQYMTGDIAEIFVYRSTLTTAQRQVIENYLRMRYALP